MLSAAASQSRRPRIPYILIALVFLWTLVRHVSAQELQLNFGSQPDQFGRQYLSGDWGGARKTLQDRGMDFNFEATDHSMWILHGGLSNQETSWPRLRGTIDIDFQKLTETRGLSFHATGLWQAGVDVGRKLGSLNDPSSLSSAHTLRLDWFWIQWIPGDGWLRIRAGQMAGYDFDGTSEYGANYLNLALGYAFSNLNQTTYLPYDPAGTRGGTKSQAFQEIRHPATEPVCEVRVVFRQLQPLFTGSEWASFQNRQFRSKCVRNRLSGKRTGDGGRFAAARSQELRWSL